MTEPGAGAQAATKSGQRAVFLSYASEDAPAAHRICAALRAAGVEVWFDQSELRGGDAWDAMIRRQIKTCALFIPIISSNSHSRAEGYFRLEWKLAVDRSHLIASDHAFLLPVVIDATPEDDDRIPERFRDVQWTRLPGGETPPAFSERVARLLAVAEPARASAAGRRHGGAPPDSAHPAPAEPAPAPSPTPTKRAWWSRPPLLAAAILGAVLIGGLGWVVGKHLAKPAAVVPYSVEDRRMTLAVLPFTAPADDAQGQQIAKAMTEAVTADLESRHLWVHVAPSRSVEEAAARHSAPKDLAKALDVHFLVRGTVAAPDTAGRSVALLLVDGGTERVLSNSSIKIAPGALAPKYRDDLLFPVRHLVVGALEEEVKRESDKSDDQLDVRGLSFRALSSWRAHRGKEAKQGYSSATALLTRALAMAPDDPLATWLTAEINLCDCVMAWSHNVEEQKAIGAAALDKYLGTVDPKDDEMLVDKAELFQLRGRYDESLVILDDILARDPSYGDALATKAQSLLKLGRTKEALPIVQGLLERYPNQWWNLQEVHADLSYMLGDYATAVQMARQALPRMSAEDLRSPVDGPVQLTLAAAEAQLGHQEAAKTALADFNAAVPGVTTVGQIKKWMHPSADLSGFEPLFQGLRLAGVKD